MHDSPSLDALAVCVPVVIAATTPRRGLEGGRTGSAGADAPAHGSVWKAQGSEKGQFGRFQDQPWGGFFFFFVLKTCHFVRQRKSKKRVVQEGWVETVPAACSGFIQASPPLPSETS